ncbi:hypothetical protein ACFWPU_11790 [Streptomyces sp. NPDC058471]|uniref:hypothetical protein n=1 Tax=Streptomyces sp. NPDC058471 TaxID=3346516 RepID=UPI003662CD48
MLLFVLVVVLLGGYVLMTRRSGPDLWAHERASGVRTVALTHTRADTGTRAEHAAVPQAPGPGTGASRTPAPEPARTALGHH